MRGKEPSSTPGRRWLGTARAVVQSDEYKALESSPGIGTQQLMELIAGVCGDALDANGRALLDLLAENGRIGYLPEIAEHFEELKAEAPERRRRRGRLRRRARTTPSASASPAPCVHDCAATCGCIALSIRR